MGWAQGKPQPGRTADGGGIVREWITKAKGCNGHRHHEAPSWQWCGRLKDFDWRGTSSYHLPCSPWLGLLHPCLLAARVRKRASGLGPWSLIWCWGFTLHKLCKGGCEGGKLPHQCNSMGTVTAAWQDRSVILEKHMWMLTLTDSPRLLSWRSARGNFHYSYQNSAADKPREASSVLVRQRTTQQCC